jgi:radical SAM superfamily enzyme YgiQ (UPF0313 family)
MINLNGRKSTKKKVTLIKAKPKRTNVYSAFAYPGLALPVLGTVLKQKGYDVKIYVEAIRQWDWDRILTSDLIGITVNSAEVKESYQLADQIRSKTKIPIIMGGYHVTFLPEEALDHCDYVVRGEGEATLAELAEELLEGKRDVEKILGVSYRKKGLVINNTDRPLVPNIDLIPDQSLIEGYKKYHRRFFQYFFPTGALVASSRGCPYNCTFCSIIEVFRRTVRFRSPEAVIEDIRQQTQLTGRNYIYFADDNFTAHIGKCKQLLKAIIDAKLNIRFSAQVRLEFSQDDEFIQLMKEAGCYLVFVGFESINPQTLLDYKKKQTVEEIVDCVERLRKAKINIHGMFVLGGDADNVETVRETARFAVDKRIDTVQFLPLYPLPGTQVIEQLNRERRLFLTLNPETGKYGLDYGVGNYVLFQTKNINPMSLQQEVLQAYEKFYSFKNIVNSIWHGSSFQSTIARCIGRYILRSGRMEFKEHIEWMRSHGFTKDFTEFLTTKSKSPDTPSEYIEIKEKTREMESLT